MTVPKRQLKDRHPGSHSSGSLFFQWAIKTEGGRGKGRGGHQKNKLEFPSAVAVPSPPGAAITCRLWGQAAGFRLPALPLAGCAAWGKTLHYCASVSSS